MRTLHNFTTNKVVKQNTKKMDSPKGRTVTQNVLTQNFLHTIISWELYFYYFYFLWRFQNVLAIAFTEDIWTPNPWSLNVAKYQKISDPQWDMASKAHFSTVSFCLILPALPDFSKLSRTLNYQTNLRKKSDMLETLWTLNIFSYYRSVLRILSNI